MNEDSTVFDYAKYYLSKDLSVIPIKPNDKKPCIKWEEFQKRKSTPEEIKSWWTRWPNAMIGIVTGSISGIVVVDIDEAIGFEEIQKYIPDSLLIPTTQTPSGGKHYYFKSPEKPLSNNTRLIPGCDFRGEGGYIIAPPSKNGTGKAYAWLEGLSIDEVALPTLPHAYISYINSYALGGYKGGIEEEHMKAHEGTARHKMFEQGSRDNDLFHTANCLVKSGMPENEIYQVIEKLAISCNPPFEQKEIPEKIESALKRAAKRERNISEDVRIWVEGTDGHFLITEYHKEAQIGTNEKHTVNVAFQRLVKEGIIEKFGEKRGCYRKVNKDCEEINWQEAGDEKLDIRLPFEIEKKVLTLPKNIIIIAGDPNAGKTAFLLNVVRMNMNKHKVYYFSSEMGPLELKRRLLPFDIPVNQWKFTPKERASNFADVIMPDDINIIDFLEIHDEFYKVGGHIKAIYDKLKNGIAIIAIQKNKGNEAGLGGGRSLEKARLYLAMENGKIKIIKAKNWASEINPNKLELNFKLVNGCKFLIEKDWNSSTNS